MPNDFRVGQVVHGYAQGTFGRDSYGCRIVEAVGRDWIVTRNSSGTVEFTSDLDFNPNDLGHCSKIEDFGGCNYCPFL